MFNTIRSLALAAVAVLSLAITEASAATFTFDNNGGNGTGVDNGPTGAFDFAVTLVSNNNGSSNVFTTATAVAAVSQVVTGFWQYSTNDVDGSSFDPFGYFIDSVFVNLVQLSQNGIPSPSFQNGSFSFNVAAGHNWGFYTVATDGIFGSSTGVALGNVSPVPLPAGGLLLLGALGGVAALRRRKAMAA